MKNNKEAPKSNDIPFSMAMDRYVATFDALQEILTLAPHAAKSDSVTADLTFMEAELRHLSPEKRKITSEVLRVLGAGLDLAIKNLPTEENKNQSTQEETISSDEARAILTTKSENYVVTKPINEPSENAFEIKIADKEVAETITNLLRKLSYRTIQPKKHRILLSSVVVMAVSAFEVLVDQLATAYFRTHPGAIGGSEKEFSLDDLRAFATIEDAREASIERRVESIGRGLTEWEKWFKSHLDITFERLCIDWKVTQEIFQRRNIIVHNDGKVSKLYLSKVPSLPSQPAIGAQVDVDEQYVKDALDQLPTLGLSLIVATWVTLHKEDTEGAAFSLIRAVHKYAESGRWQVVRTLCGVSTRLKIRQSSTIEFTYHNWLARRRLEGVQAISDAVENWDVSALSERFKIIRLCLLGKFAEAIKTLPSALKSGEVSVNQLRRLPIFEELRTQPEFESVITMQY
jgi:hypothetical protein